MARVANDVSVGQELTFPERGHHLRGLLVPLAWLFQHYRPFDVVTGHLHQPDARLVPHEFGEAHAMCGFRPQCDGAFFKRIVMV